MNLFAPSLDFRKYSLMLIMPLGLILLTLWGMEFYFEPIEGDLTRIGRLPERDFGWNRPQPFVPEARLKSAALADADVFVIGDSFSVNLLWQSRLAAKNLSHSFIHWDQLKPCDNIGAALRQAGFKGRYVVIESLERYFQERMRTACKENGDIKAAPHAGSPQPAMRERSLSTSIEKPNGGAWTLKALINRIRLSYSRPGDYIVFGDARVVAMDGCRLFSHRLCRYGLFFNGDFNKPPFDSVSNVLVINASLLKAGIQPVWLIVPDKSTVYLQKRSSTRIWDALARYPELRVPDLDDLFIRQSERIKDFYKPNDTHLSVSGFLFLGDIVAQQLQP